MNIFDNIFWAILYYILELYFIFVERLFWIIHGLAIIAKKPT